jgi:hypothetical protein
MLLKTKKFVNACLRYRKWRIYPEKLREPFEGSLDGKNNLQELACARKYL